MTSHIALLFRLGLVIGFGFACALVAVSAEAAEGMDAAPVVSADADADASEFEIRPELVVENQLPARAISLDDALALAIKHNLGVEVARYEPEIGEQDMLGAWGAYDPLLSGNVGYQLAESPNTFTINSVSKNQSRTITGGASLNTLLPYLGSTIGIEWATSRTRTNNSLESLRPKYDSSIYLTANIPLLRGLIWNDAWTQVKLTKIGYGVSEDGFRRSVMDISEDTINAYWTLVADQEQYRVATKSLETALALLDQTNTQYEVGVVSRVEVVEAEAGVADREFNLIVARNVFENSEDNLVDAVLSRDLRATMDYRIQAADDPEDYEFKEVDVERAVSTAMENLPELSAADREIEQREIELKFAENSMLPQFDVDARYGFVNISGSQTSAACSDFARPPGQTLADCLAGLQSTGYSRSYDDLYTEDGAENYTVGGTFSIPIPNRSARRNVTKREIELRRAKTLKTRTEQDVILSVRAAARGILASARGIEAAERRRLAAEEQLRAERIRLEHGESTPFEVLQRESDLVDAESQKIGALQSYRAAEARLERAQGTILATYRIEVEDARGEPYR